nr:unnamed protein product [Callosobruchus analis]
MVIGSLGGMRNTLLSALRATPVCRAAVHILAARMQKAVILGSLEAAAEIAGAPDVHVRAGSPLRLACAVRRATEPPAYVFWYHGRRMINHEPGVTVTGPQPAGTVEGYSSDVFPINARVPQGSVLSPTLFLLYINGLLEITSNPVYSFEDDSTLVSCMEPGKPLPSQETARLRHHHASQINADIGKVVE